MTCPFWWIFDDVPMSLFLELIMPFPVYFLGYLPREFPGIHCLISFLQLQYYSHLCCYASFTHRHTHTYFLFTQQYIFNYFFLKQLALVLKLKHLLSGLLISMPSLPPILIFQFLHWGFYSADVSVCIQQAKYCGHVVLAIT